TVLYGSPRPDPGSTLFSQGTAAYRMNAPLDLNRDGRITAGEATSFVRQRIDGEAPPPRDVPAPDPGGNDRPAPAPSGSVTVRSGDTLSGIAARNGVGLADLIAANPQIRNPNLIYPGQTVHLPGGGGGGAAGGDAPVRSADPPPGGAARTGAALGARHAPHRQPPTPAHP